MDAATILVLDDSPPVREMLAAVLRRGGHQVLTAADGEEGLRVFADGGLAGIWLCGAVRSIERRLRARVV